MKYLFIMILSLPLLASCASKKERFREYRQACKEYGFQPGTDDYAECLQKFDNYDRNERIGNIQNIAGFAI